MAPKRSTPLDDPPSASSDDDETEEEQEQEIITRKINEESSTEEELEEEEEESEEEEQSEEETIDPVKTPLEKPKIQHPNSSSEEELESESDDEEEQTATPVKTSVEKPKTLTPKSSSISVSEPDLRSPTASDFVIKPSKKINVMETPEKTPTSKRPSDESDTNNRKKSKVSNGDVDDEKKSVVKRVWSDDDELFLLQGFIDYQSEKGCSPLLDMDGFYRFIMSSLPGNASKNQLYDKVRRLKKKFRVNSEKVSGTGEDPVFSKPHEHKLFKLSKKIWGIGGSESVSGSGGFHARSKAKPKIEVKEEDEDDEMRAKVEDFETLYPYWNAGLNLELSPFLSFPKGVATLIKKYFNMIGEAKAKEMDEKWKAHFDIEAELRKRRATLLGNVTCNISR